jgi:cysteinyl-tRNA synthetase
LLKALGNVLGLLQQDAEKFLQGAPTNVTLSIDKSSHALSSTNIDIQNGQGVDDLIIARAEAKKAKNYAEADRIRKELSAVGIILEDSPQGTTWRRS